MKDLIDALPVLFFVAGVLLERVASARGYPTVPWWRAKGLAFFALGGGAAMCAGAGVMRLAGGRSLFVGEAAGLWGAPLGLLCLTFTTYWMHRAFHASPRLWRWVHQLHHSAERVDVYTAFWAHPFESALQGAVMMLVLRLVLGLGPTTAAGVGAATMLINVLQHLNVRTPRWLGYLVQRPESHNLHHARAVHGFNYGDLPLWDMLFGTWRNPANATGPVGFWDGASRRLGAMLVGRDVTRAPDEIDARRRASAAGPSPV